MDAPLLRVVSLALLQSTPDVGGHIHKFVERHQQLLKNKVWRLVIQAVVPSISFVKSFETLQEFLVISPGAISMFDIVDIFMINDDKSWSRSLTRLHFKQENPSNGISITALYLIADACPNLKSIEISIHHPMVKTHVQERKPHDLKKLVFFNLPGVWVESMALAIDLVSHLDHLFPPMAVPEYTGGKEDNPGALATREAWWRGVQDMWRMCQTSKGRKNTK